MKLTTPATQLPYPLAEAAGSAYPLKSRPWVANSSTTTKCRDLFFRGFFSKESSAPFVIVRTEPQL